MVIEPKVRDFICTTAHPVGCREAVRRQIAYVQQQGPMDGPKKVLIIGASTGYGLATRIAAAFGCGAATLGLMYERPSSGKRTATAGWYNTQAFEEAAAAQGLYARSINGDAFSREIKEQAIEAIRQDLGQVDLVVYSLAAPKRLAPDGVLYSSVLKATGTPFENKNLDLRTNQVNRATIPAATQEEIDATVKVMGGEDWLDWCVALNEAGVLAPGARTIAYSYIGPELTYPVYHNGTIGAAKQHLAATVGAIQQQCPGLDARISVNKALVTQASSAIPVVPLYLSLLYRVMKEDGCHEGCIQQMDRLFRQKLASGVQADENGWIRLDDWELQPEIQKKVMELWEQVNSENLSQLADLDGYWQDFYQMFGFGFDNIDYTQDVAQW